MVYRISNFLVSNARKVCKFFFGDFYISCDLNERERCFEIRLRKEIIVKQKDGRTKTEDIEDYIDIDHFKKYWGPQWKIMFSIDEEV